MRNVIGEMAHLAKDWWLSRGEARKAPDSMSKALRDASFAGGSKAAVAPSEEILQQAAEAGERYNDSFKND